MKNLKRIVPSLLLITALLFSVLPVAAAADEADAATSDPTTSATSEMTMPDAPDVDDEQEPKVDPESQPDLAEPEEPPAPVEDPAPVVEQQEQEPIATPQSGGYIGEVTALATSGSPFRTEAANTQMLTVNGTYAFIHDAGLGALDETFYITLANAAKLYFASVDSVTWPDGSFNQNIAVNGNDIIVSFTVTGNSGDNGSFAINYSFNHTSFDGKVPNGTVLANVTATSTLQDTPQTLQVMSIATLPATPGTPTISSVSRTSTNYVSVKWGAVANATGYEVYRATSTNGSYAKIATISGTSFTDTGVKDYTTYYYKVRAYAKTSAGDTAFGSYSAAKKIALITKPAKPTVSSVSRTSANYVSVKWGKVANTTGYEVYRATTSGGKYTKIATTKGTSYTDKSVKDYKTYYYKVRAYAKTSAGDTAFGSYSAAKKITLNMKPRKAAITSVTITSANKITVKWGKAAYATGYRVYRATSANGKYTTIKNTSGTSFTDKSVKGGKTYYYKVKAYKKAPSGKVTWAASSAYAKAKVVTTIPTMKVSGTSPTAAKVSWTRPNGKGVQYQVYRATSASGSYTKIATVKAASYTDKTVKADKTYYYKVRAYSTTNGAASYGRYSPAKSAKWTQTQAGDTIVDEVVIYEEHQYCNGCGADITGIGAYEHMKSMSKEELMNSNCGGSTFKQIEVGRERKVTEIPDKGYWK